jgi:hypothetical protein
MLNQPFYTCRPYLHHLFPLTMLSKTPMPYMSLRARQKDSQKHPGRPDQPRTKRSTQEVQAEKAEKAAVQAQKRPRVHRISRTWLKLSPKWKYSCRKNSHWLITPLRPKRRRLHVPVPRPQVLQPPPPPKVRVTLRPEQSLNVERCR